MHYGPDLIYLPEVPFSMEKFLSDVEKVYKKNGKVIVAVSEGCKDEQGRYIPEMVKDNLAKDAFGHAQLGGAASVLAEAVKEKFGTKVRGIEFSLMQRCAAHIASLTDINEAYMAGQEAVRAACAGITDKMIAFERVSSNPYKCVTKLVNLSDVANTEKKLPAEWIINDGTFVSDDFVQYALPLIQGSPEYTLEDSLPRFAQLKKVLAKPE